MLTTTKTPRVAENEKLRNYGYIKWYQNETVKHVTAKLARLDLILVWARRRNSCIYELLRAVYKSPRSKNVAFYPESVAAGHINTIIQEIFSERRTQIILEMMPVLRECSRDKFTTTRWNGKHKSSALTDPYSPSWAGDLDWHVKLISGGHPV